MGLKSEQRMPIFGFVSIIITCTFMLFAISFKNYLPGEIYIVFDVVVAVIYAAYLQMTREFTILYCE